MYDKACGNITAQVSKTNNADYKGICIFYAANTVAASVLSSGGTRIHATLLGNQRCNKGGIKVQRRRAIIAYT
jgi:hypothetical protein